MDIKRMCKNVGHDGETYFCMRCGKAGFDSKAKAIGHQAQCPAKESNLGALPLPTTTTDSHQTTTTLPLPSMILPPDMKAIERMLTMQGQQIADIKKYQERYSNEVPHMQAVNSQGFLGINKNVWIGAGVLIFIAYMLGRENCHCDCSTINRSRNRVSGLGSNMAGKIAGKFIDRIF